jgi:hypothetical protein
MTAHDRRDPDFYTGRHSERTLMDIWSHSVDIQRDAYAMQKFNGFF